MRNLVQSLLGLLFMGSTAIIAQQPLGDVARQTGTQQNPAIRVIHHEPPIYPAEAKAKGIGGTVIVEVVVGRHGNVSSAKVIEGDKIFREAALTAVKAWKFQPPTTQELPVERITVHFEPKGGS